MVEVAKCNIALFKQLMEDNDDNTVMEENGIVEGKVCLITNDKLEDNCIKLECNHVFNYTSLYNEIVYQKTKKILDNSLLKINEIKCPYCRNITSMLLPCYKYYSVNPVRGVTNPVEHAMKLYECEHIKAGIKCGDSACKMIDGIYCNKHMTATKKEHDIIANEPSSTFDLYKKMKVCELKELLKLNNCKVGGKKEELAIRIIINKVKKDWIDK
jgi:hypothetical protein